VRLLGTERFPTEDLVPPRGTASVVFDAPEGMCGGTIFSCLGLDDAQSVELIARKGEEVLMRTFSLVMDDGLYRLPQVPDCIEMRRRSRTGTAGTSVTHGSGRSVHDPLALPSFCQTSSCRLCCPSQ
jgi:hypothetical protein